MRLSPTMNGVLSPIPLLPKTYMLSGRSKGKNVYNTVLVTLPKNLERF
jgi:hypothetical protein